MRLWTCLFAALWLARALPGAAADPPAPPLDWEQTRALQQRAATGDPVLPPAPGGSHAMLLGVAELGMGVAAGRASDFRPGDYDALYSLLQRYRDELAGLGLDVEAMEERLRATEAAAGRLERRLQDLLPLDGAKIHGRLVTSFEDFHLLGPLQINIAAPSFRPEEVVRYQNKPRGDGVRFQTGVTRAELDFQVTRGPFSGHAELGLAALWGANVAEAALRRLYGELRTPVAVQFGHIDASLSPLTLWRNEEAAPHEPEPFRGRRQRLRRDHQLKEHRWRVSGVRLSSDVRLLDGADLQLESLSAVPALGFYDNSIPGVAELYRFGVPGAGHFVGDQLVVTSNTLLQAWRAGLRMGPATLSYLGTYTFGVTETRAANPWRASTELVQGGRLELALGPVRGDLEGMVSTYVAPSLTSAAQPLPLSGTALRAALGLEGERASLRLKGRVVSSGFHAAAAQGRTQDRNHQLLGPLATEQGMLGAAGRLGFANPAGAGYVLTAPQNRWNRTLIPAGVMIRRQTTLAPTLVPAGAFGHLLPFSFLDSLAPYGEATPNRMGGGAEAELRLMDGALVPSLGFDLAAQPEDTNDPVLDPVNAGNKGPAQVPTKGFAMQQARAGVATRFRLGLPLALDAGYTLLDVRNGQASPLLDAQGQALPFALSAGLLEAGAQAWLTPQLALQLGWRRLGAKGVGEKEAVSRGGEAAWTQRAVGLALDLGDGLRFDLLWEQLDHDNPDLPLNAYSLENAYARITVEF